MTNEQRGALQHALQQRSDDPLTPADRANLRALIQAVMAQLGHFEIVTAARLGFRQVHDFLVDAGDSSQLIGIVEPLAAAEMQLDHIERCLAQARDAVLLALVRLDETEPSKAPIPTTKARLQRMISMLRPLFDGAEEGCPETDREVQLFIELENALNSLLEALILYE